MFERVPGEGIRTIAVSNNGLENKDCACRVTGPIAETVGHRAESLNQYATEEELIHGGHQ